MTDSLTHRGPDARGIWFDGHAALGHRRLSIIDLEHGAQPMTVTGASEQPLVLSFCGEIYNFKELRSELMQLGHTFRTRSDTEVLLRGYAQWQDDVSYRLNGMYAVAIWDAARKKLVLIRDRLGVKPLYYC
ncbi:MAG: asparagine synthetase B, partial [Burkholderiaceae bacterium]